MEYCGIPDFTLWIRVLGSGFRWEEHAISIKNPLAYGTLSVGVVLRRSPGVTRWVPWVWTVSGLLPGARPANWLLLREEGRITEYHAATPTLELHGAETEAYLHGLHSEQPSLYVVLRQKDHVADRPLEVALVTASPYEAQDYCENGEDIVERVPMPPAIEVFVADFVEAHHEEEVFIKRRRDKKRVDLTQDGIGDARIATEADIYASPALKRRRLQ